MKSLSSLTKSCLVAATVAASALSAHAQLLNLNPVADTYVYFGQAGRQATNYGTLGNAYISSINTARESFGYFRFDLGALPSGATLTSASLTFFKVSDAERNDGLVTGRFGVYGLNNVVGNTAQNWGETTLTFNNRGAEWTAVNTFDLSRLTNLDEALGNEVVTGGTSAAVSGNNLLGFLNTRIADGGLATFLVDFPALDSSGRGYGLGTRENANSALIPVLALTYREAGAVPEPATNAALVLAALGGAVAFARRRARR